MAGITLLGLGPGSQGLLTRQAWELITSKPEIYLRTRKHPVIDDLPASLLLHDFDALYESSANFEEIYQQIVDQILELGKRPEGVVYAVPGHPFVGEATCPEIARRAKDLNIPVQVVEGLSFLEPVFTAIGTDPLPNTVLIDAFDLAGLHIPSFPPNFPAVVVQIHSRGLASEVKLTLMENYLDDHPVQLVHAAGTAQCLIENLPLHEIDQSPHIGLLTSLYVPAREKERSYEAFQEIIAHLRAPEGCPWDQRQTHQSLRSSLVEEVYEVLEALDADDPSSMQEELGDLLLHIVMQAQIGSELGEFTIGDILAGINTKIVSRHPHVFGDMAFDTEAEIIENWERLKVVERSQKPKSKTYLLDSVALALPALIQAQQYQERASRVGFDWTDLSGVNDKVLEELAEVKAEQSANRLEEELGDLLFAVVNLARWYKADAESALRGANQRFRQRFNYIEQSARSQEKAVSDLSRSELDALWEASKKLY